MKNCKLLLLFLLIGFKGFAQLCTGSLGDPVINISFGNINNTLSPLKPGITNLGYINTGCPLDGNYTITNSAMSCFGNTWHNILSDHTGDQEGRMMLINATNSPNVFFTDTIIGLCGNSTYEFGAWVANVLKPSSCGGNGTKPDLTFTIETLSGTTLQSYNTGKITEEASLTFKQYGFLFKPDISTTTIVLRIANNAGTGCGNDLAIDDITFRPCGPAMNASIDGVASFNKSICINNQTVLSLNMNVSTGYLSPVFQWQIKTNLDNNWSDIPGAITKNYTRNGTNVGTYQYRLVAGESVYAAVSACKTASLPITIKINNEAPRIGNQTIHQCIGGTVNLIAASGSGSSLSYQWTGPNGFSANTQNPILNNIHLIDTGKYTVVVSTLDGCTSSDTISITAYNDINATYSGKTIICLGDSTLLTAMGGNQINWYNNAGAIVSSEISYLAKPTDTTSYNLIFHNTLGCSDSINIPIDVIKPPIVDAGPNKIILQGNSSTLLGSIKGQYTSYLWTPLNNILQQNTLTPIVSPLNTTTYSLLAYGLNGCTIVNDTVQVKVLVSILPPNSFSPNGDGIHDIWLVPGLETYLSSSVTIFNRNGQIVYQAKPYFEGWDGKYKGKDLPTGVYYYMVNLGNGEAMLSGSIYLIK